MKDINKKNFTHFKIHTQYSICEGALKISDLAKKCKEKKIPAIAICDTGNLCGALEFSEALAKSGTQPIIGTQINLKYNDFFGSLPLFAKDLDGYKNLIKLSSKSFLEINESDSPHCLFEDLIENNRGLVVFSGSLDSLFGKLFIKNRLKDLDKLASIIKVNFKDNFYLEIQRHNDIGEKDFENFLLKFSLVNNFPLIATQEVFYLNKDMHEAHDAFICVGEKTYINEKNRKRYTNQHYLKDNEEMIKTFQDLPEAIENNFNLPFKFNYRPKKSEPVLPNIKTHKSLSVEDELEKQANEGLEYKLNEFVLSKIQENKKKEIIKTYKNRLSHEIKIINKMKYAGYFLIVSDYINWAKKNDIPVGPGRGSGAGSLVAWCLSITDIDPIKFDLIFERFLNPDRISMPDFDIDFCEEKRDQVFKYLKNKYGKGVAHIITFGKLKARMAIRDIGRVLGLPYGFVDSLSKMIPFEPSRPLTLVESVAREPRLKELESKDSRVKKLLELSTKLEGLNRNRATHAAGVVIAEKNLADLVPLYKDFSSNLLLPATQFDMYSSEDAGLIKFDLLGLKTLTVIRRTINILKGKKINLEISKISLEDPDVFKLLASGNTVGLFQLESSGMREALIQMKPNKFEDIIALVALYRPGPMNNIVIYNQCKHGKKEPDYLHPNLKKILEPTYGVIIYQEQVMQIAQTLSGFSAGEADILRRAMGKKKRLELEKQKERFIEGAIKNGIQKDVASYIFKKIEPFAEYGFNKSHATAYAMIAYQTAYLKTYYSTEFISASMSNDMSNTDKLSEFFEEAKRLNIRINPPSINNCYSDFITGKKEIFYALGAIKNVGFEAISQIIKERELNGKFKSLNDFVNRINPKNINKLQLEGLVKAGTFKCLYKNTKALFESIPKIILNSKTIHENKSNSQISFFNEENTDFSHIANKKIEDWSNEEILTKEFESVGFYISNHPVNEHKDLIETYNVLSFKDFINNENLNEAVLAATILKIQEKKSAKGTSFAIIKFSDLSGVFELLIFSDLLEQNRKNFKEGLSFLITVLKDKKNIDNRYRRITIKKIKNLKEETEKNYNEVLIELNNSNNLNLLSEIIKKNGNSSIKILVKKNNKKYTFSLKNKREFSYKTFKMLKKEPFIRKINLLN